MLFRLAHPPFWVTKKLQIPPLCQLALRERPNRKLVSPKSLPFAEILPSKFRFSPLSLGLGSLNWLHNIFLSRNTSWWTFETSGSFWILLRVLVGFQRSGCHRSSERHFIPIELWTFPNAEGRTKWNSPSNGYSYKLARSTFLSIRNSRLWCWRIGRWTFPLNRLKILVWYDWKWLPNCSKRGSAQIRKRDGTSW